MPRMYPASMTLAEVKTKSTSGSELAESLQSKHATLCLPTLRYILYCIQMITFVVLSRSNTNTEQW